ncbi:hypothetical protein M9458_031292, partial [Cirrhinus mrigala]
ICETRDSAADRQDLRQTLTRKREDRRKRSTTGAKMASETTGESASRRAADEQKD